MLDDQAKEVKEMYTMEEDNNGIKDQVLVLNNLILKMIIKDKNQADDSAYRKTSDSSFKENKDKGDIRQRLSIKKIVVVFLIQKQIQLKENNKNKKLVKKILLFNKKIIHLKVIQVKLNRKKLNSLLLQHLNHIYFLFFCRCSHKQQVLKNKLRCKKEILIMKRLCSRR